MDDDDDAARAAIRQHEAFTMSSSIMEGLAAYGPERIINACVAAIDRVSANSDSEAFLVDLASILRATATKIETRGPRSRPAHMALN